MANLNTDLLSPEQAIEATVAAYNSKAAIAKIEGLEANSLQINYLANEERKIPSLIVLPYLKHLRVWMLKESKIFETNIKAKKLFEDVFADAIYYVSPSGNDSTGTGTKANPFRSIIKAFYCEYTTAKRTIYVEAGTYLDDYGFASVNFPSSITDVNIIGYGGLAISERTTAETNLKIKANCNVYMENIVCKGGTYPCYAIMTNGSYNELYTKNCAFLNSTTSTGFSWNGNGIIVHENSLAKGNALDGFGYQLNITTTVANRKLLVVEINCKATANGTIANSNNGSTTHDGVVSVRINGDYRGNANRDIHDIRNSYSWLLGCKAESVEDWQGNFVCGENTETDFSYMWLDTCTSTGIKQKDIVKWTQGEIYAYNFDGSGTSIGYTPIAYDYKA